MAKINIADVKKAFVQGATPNEGNYQDLINLAAVGYKALGNDTADGKPGAGLEMDKNGKLQVKEGPGIAVSADGVAAKVDDETVGINKGTQQLEVKLPDNSGLDRKGGLHVQTGPGIKADKDGLSVNLADNSGLTHNQEVNKQYPLQVSYDKETSGLTVDDQNRLTVNVPQTVTVNGKTEENYLTQDKNGLYLTDTGIGKMKDAMASVSITALDAAVKATASGFTKDKNPGATDGTVEARIAAELNTAYANGYMLPQVIDACTNKLKEVVSSDFKKNIIKDTAAMVCSTDNQALKAKAPDMTQAPAEYGTDSLLGYRLGDDGIMANMTSVVLASANPTQLGKGVFLFIGKITDKGVPDKAAMNYTQYATLVVGVGADYRAWTVGYFDLLADCTFLNPSKLENPASFADGYQKGYGGPDSGGYRDGYQAMLTVSATALNEADELTGHGSKDINITDYGKSHSGETARINTVKDIGEKLRAAYRAGYNDGIAEGRRTFDPKPAQRKAWDEGYSALGNFMYTNKNPWAGNSDYDGKYNDPYELYVGSNPPGRPSNPY